MNNYNENLRSTVLNALSIQELDQKKLRSQKNAALFTLYYAQGAVMTASQKLEAAKQDRDVKAGVRKQATDSSNLANNQLASATQADQYTRISVSNAAVCAANVQVAARSIVRLAGDIGSMLSILQATDPGSALYKSAEHISGLINDTAYRAEAAADMAMQASVSTSEVPSSTLLDNTKTVNGLVNNLLKICSTDFKTASQAAVATNDHLEAASVSSSLAEGNLQDIDVDLQAAQSAYQATNKQLNLDLKVGTLTETSFTLSFYPITDPFEIKKAYTSSVEGYCIIVVKESKKLTFSIVSAEAIFSEGEQGGRLINIPNVKPDLPCSHVVKFKDIALRDADGDEISYGQRYVVFLLASYAQAYKIGINNFNDYLSAPSNSFVLTMNWPKALITTKPAAAIRFHAQNNPLCDGLPEYRCIILPATKGLSKPGFVFDRAIAQQVPAGNYTVAVADGADHYTAAIGSETTDNFGNPLIDQAEYDVLVLTTSGNSIENTARFSDVLSDLSVHSKFQYQIKDPS